MKAGNKIKYFLLSAVLRLLSFLPLGVHRALGRFSGFITGSVVKYRRGVVEKNLANAFPEKSVAEREEIRKKFYRHLGTIFCEAIWLGSVRGNERRLRRARFAEVRGQELINEYHRKNRSMMVLAGHTGNFETIAGILTYAAYTVPLELEQNDISVAYKRLHNEIWDKFIFNNRLAPIKDRGSYTGLVESDSVMRYVYNKRNSGNIFHFITDQYPYGDSGSLEVNFFGQKTPSMVGGAALAKMLAMPVFYLRFECRADGGYTMTYVPLCDDASKEEIQDLTDRYYALLEEDLRKQPWNYLWTHKRWKTLNY